MAEQFATSTASNLVAKLGEYLFAPIGRQFGYVLCYKSYVKDLENGIDELEIARERVQRSVDAAKYNGKPIFTYVQNWLTSVEKEAEEAKGLLKHGESTKNACFWGWIPNPVVRHPIGRKVKKMTQVIQGLHENSRNENFKNVFYENAPIGLVTGTTSAERSKKEDVLESRASITKDVMKAIADDKVRVIGVYGPGGVGKSKLLEDIERQVKQEKLFDWIATANVSRNPDLKRIQGEIASALGLKLMNEETTRGRANLLRKRLETDPKQNILIILDNLWTILELKEVGIPYEDNNKVKGCKLLLTSRYRDVLRIDMSSDQEFQLNKLEHGEARRLFERTVGYTVNDHEFEPCVDGVVKNCGGLPLLIILLAKRLKRGDLAAWRYASNNIDESDVKSLVELNYIDLKDERIKLLFLFCALNSGRIFVRHSLVCCMGLGLFKNFSETLENARDRLIKDIHSLQDSSLLLDSDDMEQFRIDDMVDFRMHDIFVDVAISISSAEWNALVGRKDFGFKEWSKDELRKCIAISFPWVGIDELPEKLDCPQLRMLLLYEDNLSPKVPESFFESMEKLQVLDLTGFSFTSLPSSIEFLENLMSLCLYECHLEDVTVLGKLKELQFLIFHGSSITRLPKEIGELTKLRLLDLTLCTRLKVIEPGVLGSLVNLEELYMEGSFDRWEAEDEAPQSNASLAELKNMKNLSTLSVAIPHSANLSGGLPFGELNNHKIQIGDAWDWSGEYKESRTFKLKLDSSNLLLEEWVSKFLQETQDLHLDGLQDGIDSIHDLCVEGFQELKHLHIQNSPSFQYVVHSIENVQCTAFTRLESLFLKNLSNLEKICRGCLALESFSKLKIVKVDKCGEIKHLFPLSIKRIIPQLEEIEISRCRLMQQIAADAVADEDRDEINDDTKVKSYNLRRLTLRNLPNMTSFCKTADHSVNFFDRQQLIKLQSLEAITIERCQLIREVFDLEGLTANGQVEILSRLRELTLSDLPSLGHIWNKNTRRTLCFRNLRTLKVQNCENLRFLFSSSMAKALGQIKEIEIASCKLMELIIDEQEEESEEVATTDTLEFPLLTSLSLEDLPNLRTFSYGKYHIHYPSLTRLTISGCPKMITFSLFEGKQQSMTVDTGLQQAFGRINSGLSMPVFFNEKVHLPSLEELELSSMCELKRIWPNQLHGQSFYKLESLTVGHCENLLHVFPSKSMDGLQSLNKIEVVDCPSLEALFEPISLSSEKRQKPLVLSSLEKVKLLNLPRLRDMLKSDCKVTLAFPSLMEVNVSHCQSLPYLFSSATAITLDKLAVLDVSCCNNLLGIIAMENGKWNTVETLKFRRLSTLKLGDLENLISFRSASCAGDGLHSLFDEKLAFPKLEELHIKGVQQKELWNEKILVESFCRLKVLKVKQCHNLMNVIPSFMWKRLLHCVEYLTVESCNLIEGIFMLEGPGVMEREATRSGPWRELTLCDLPNLTNIWKNEDLLNRCLHNLTSIRVETCPHLIKLFTISTAKSLGQLQYLGLRSCGEMEYIVAREEEKPEEAADMIVIPKLVTLHLNNMPKLRSFCHGKHISEWPSLKVFIVEGCNAMEVIDGDVGCRKLEGSISTQQPLLLVEKLIKLQNLEDITVERCQLIREVFDLEELTSERDVEILSRLTRLTLSELPSLERIWNKNPRRALCFRNLRALKVQNCENLRFLFSSSMAKALVQIKTIEIASCVLMEEIMDMQQEELEEAATADTLEFPMLTSLSIVELPNLRTFSYGKYCIHCPSLTKLTISGCTKMLTFTSFKVSQQSMTADISVQQAFGRFNSGLSLSGFFNEKVLFPSLEELKLSSMCQLKRIWHNQLPGQSFCKLTSLIIELCENLSHVFPANSMDSLHSLNKIEVVGCPSLEALFEPVSLSSEKRQKPLVLSALKKMKLLNLPRLRDILKSDCKVTLAIPSLMEVNVRRCHSLPYLFSSATAKTLDKLAVLDVSCCNNLRGIIVIEEGKGKTVETLKFRHLSTLKLGDLKNLICFSSKSCVSGGLHPLFDEKLAFPKLEELHVEGVQQKELWNDKILAESFCSLKVLKVKQCPNLMNVIPSFMWKRLLHCVESLTVDKCPRLRNLFTMSMANSLGQLQHLGLSGCGEMEYIVARKKEKLEEETDRIVIPQLVTLYLHNMPKLKSFCQGKHISEWPSLKERTVEDCKAAEVILGDASYKKLEYNVSTQQPLLLFEKVEFPNMESMKISHMDNVEKIWLDDLASNAFSKLKTLVVEYCEKLSSIFSSYTMLTRFQNLEKIIVTDCGSLEVVFHIQEFNFSEARSTSTFQLRELVLARLPKMKHVWSGLPQGGLTFGCLRSMEVKECEGLKSLFPSLTAKSMTQLEKLLVKDCGVEEIIAEEDIVGMNASDLFFPRLTDLRLLELPELRSFYNNSHTSTLPLLKELRVRHCANMRSFSLGTTTSENQPAFFSFEKVNPQLERSTLRREDVAMLQHHTFVNLRELSLSCYHDENVAFPSDFLLHRFPNLEELTVSCNSFEEIFPEDASGHGGASLKALGNLKRLRLNKLCNLRRVWKDGSLMAEILKQIEDLFVWQCPSLSIVFPSPASFQSLTELEVQDCAGLVHMGTCSAMTTLVHLTLLTLRDSGAMEDVVTDDGNEAEEISFPKLEQLILDRLPSLEGFSPANCAFVFPSLVRITVKQCPKMNTFCKGALRTPKLNGVYLSFDRDDEGRWEGDLNTTIQTLST